MQITYIVYTTGFAKSNSYSNQPTVPNVGTFIRLRPSGVTVSNQVRSVRVSPGSDRWVEVFILLSSSDEMKYFDNDVLWSNYPVADLPL